MFLKKIITVVMIIGYSSLVLSSSSDLTVAFVQTMQDHAKKDLCLAILADRSKWSRINFDQRDKRTGCPVLMLAIELAPKEVALELLHLKNDDGSLVVDVNAINNFGDTVLIKAIERAHPSVAIALLELESKEGSAVADVNQHDRRGSDQKGISPLSVCMRQYSLKRYDSYLTILDKLLQKGAVVTNNAKGLPFFHALKPDISEKIKKEPNTLLLKEYIVVDAYEKFLKGRQNNLHALCFSSLINDETSLDHHLVVPILTTVLKSEWIKPILSVVAQTPKEQELIPVLKIKGPSF